MWQSIKQWGSVVVLLLALGTVGLGAWQQYAHTVLPTPTPVPGPVTPGPVEPVPTKPNGAEIVVIAPSEGEVGQLIRINVSGSKGQTFKWLCIPQDADFEVYDNGKKVCFSSSKVGVYTFIVASANDNELDSKIIIITIGQPVIEPPLPPNSSLVVNVTSWVSTLVKSTDKKIEAAKLAASFRAIAVQIDSGDLNDVEKIVTATSAANKAVLKDSINDWVTFLAQLQKELKVQAQAGTLVTVEQHASIWKEIAKGLEAASK